jgi:hypothetical protein
MKNYTLIQFSERGLNRKVPMLPYVAKYELPVLDEKLLSVTIFELNSMAADARHGKFGSVIFFVDN